MLWVKWYPSFRYYSRDPIEWNLRNHRIMSGCKNHQDLHSFKRSVILPLTLILYLISPWIKLRTARVVLPGIFSSASNWFAVAETLTCPLAALLVGGDVIQGFAHCAPDKIEKCKKWHFCWQKTKKKLIWNLYLQKKWIMKWR